MKTCPACYRCFEDSRRLCPDDGASLQTVFEGEPILDGKYRLVERLGRGGWGEVYKSRHLALKRLVAIKVLHQCFVGDARAATFFEREAEALGRLCHPNIVEVMDFGVDRQRGLPYLVMEYLKGDTLARKVRSRESSDLVALLPIFDQIAAAVDHAHAEGILHLDLKPSNVLLVSSDDGEIPRAKVVDFGQAQFFVNDEETPTMVRLPGSSAAHGDGVRRPAVVADIGKRFGTPGYQAPEILRGEPPSPAADVYSFGSLIVATLTGRPPGQAMAEISVETGSGELTGEVAANLATILAKSPAERPTSARRAVDALRQANHRRHRPRLRPIVTRCLAWAGVLAWAAVVLVVVLEAPWRRLEIGRTLDSTW